MSNPVLRRDSPEHDWVEYLQRCLAGQLAAEAAAGTIRLSAVDGYFGPITEASVTFFQNRVGLAATGVVDDATWQAVEAPVASSTPTPSSSAPVNLSVPFTLRTRWQDATLAQAHADLLRFDLATQPNTQLQFTSTVGRLFGNGGPQLLNLQLRKWDWFLDWSTRATLDYSRSKGVELGVDNHADLGVRPLRGLELSVEGNLNLRWAPQTATGSLSFDTMFWVKLNFDLLGH
jgi:peptidoglycan hydrolase-like protein with peptidoglycan-binding domain